MDESEEKRDLVLKRMMGMEPESAKELAGRKRVDRYKDQAKAAGKAEKSKKTIDGS